MSGCGVNSTIETAVRALTAGRPVLVVGGETHREVAEVLIPAALATPKWTAWAVRYTSGLLCATLRSTRADELELPAMVRAIDASAGAPAFGVGVDAAVSVGTGISATDRAYTARVLANSDTRPEDLTRPGHVLPLRTAPRGVIERKDSGEASVDLCDIADLAPVGLTGTLLGDDGSLLQGAALSNFARIHRLPIVRIDDVVHHRLHHGGADGARVRQITTRVMDVPDRSMRVIDFEDTLTSAQHTVFIGSMTRAEAPTVYILAECPHRDPLSFRCRCQREFERHRTRIVAEGGIIIYLRSGRWPAAQYSVHEYELTQGCITAILIDLGLTSVAVSGWPSECPSRVSSCEIQLALAVQDPDFRAAASL
ncbi:3,4-dihydroxy-2-butanone-4-phosphate synthase [Rhodococcus rhodochrous]|uniref:3,4-dihydroxy-2-butanone-4-phosphate synthase n=1 Tax=Rhodococcus rhodochrous TaxID=1829 RepID=UPI0009BECC98